MVLSASRHYVDAARGVIGDVKNAAAFVQRDIRGMSSDRNNAAEGGGGSRGRKEESPLQPGAEIDFALPICAA